jgi:hypothetical protein
LHLPLAVAAVLALEGAATLALEGAAALTLPGSARRLTNRSVARQRVPPTAA